MKNKNRSFFELRLCDTLAFKNEIWHLNIPKRSLYQ